MDERTQNPVDPAKVKEGDLMAFVYYTRVEQTLAMDGSRLRVRDLDHGQGFDVLGVELVSAALSADQFAKEEMVTKTRAAELLVASPNRPLTVNFVKQSGEERTLRGRLVQSEPLLGRSYVEDLDLPLAERKGSRLRLVDHRTILYLIVDGVKYTVK